MKLEKIIKNPLAALNYMERLVNNGSPSGFTGINSTSKETNPFNTDGFYLKIISNGNMTTYGKLPKDLCGLEGLLVHPDWENYIDRKELICDTSIYVTPTSSGRTVKVLDRDYYIKLSYPGVIGRMRRDLEEKHILSCIQMTQILNSLVCNGKVNKLFSYMPESAGCLTSVDGINTGYIVRDATPVGKNTDKIAYVIPGFSLFGKDRRNRNDTEILNQILLYKNAGNDYLLLEMIQPLIDIYFNCLLEEGISPEMHSQNILFGFDKDWNVVSIILRDLESIDKDITIRKALGKSDFINMYKTIQASDYNYFIKHSFMFDHKLGEYLIEELIKCASKVQSVNESELRKSVKEYTHRKYGEHLAKLFPSDGKWYKFPNVEINHDLTYRPYLALDNSVLR